MNAATDEITNSRNDSATECDISTLKAMLEDAFFKGKYGEALESMCRLFESNPSLKEAMKSHFVIALGKYTKYLENCESWDTLFNCFKRVLNVFSDCEDVHYTLGAILFRLGFVDKAACYFRQALTLNPNFIAAKESLESVRNALLERWHFPMLNDRSRNEAYFRAIHKAISQGYDSVLDIGTGTGLLSMFAVQCGAKEVYACEVSETMCSLARDVVEANGFASKITLINKMSTDMVVLEDLPRRVSLITTEIFDAGLFGEGVISTLVHAHQELLLSAAPSTNHEESKRSEGSIDIREHAVSESNGRQALKKGRVVPQSADVWACLIECKTMRDKIRVESDIFDDLNLNIEQDQEEPYTTERLSAIKGGFRFLCKPWKLLSVRFDDIQELETLQNGISHEFSVQCFDCGWLDAVVVWFDLHLDKEIAISTHPTSTTCWEQAIFPVLPSRHLKGKPIWVTKSSIVKVNVTCKDHLVVKCSDVHEEVQPTSALSSSENEVLPNFSAICLRPEIIQTLNDKVLNDCLRTSLNAVFRLTPHPSVIVLKEFPWIGILALRLGAKWCCCCGQHSDEEEDVITSLTESLDSVDSSKLLFSDVEDLSDTEESSWDALFFNPVEMSGILRPQIIEDIALLRASDTLTANSLIAPSKVSVYCQAIESNALLEQSCVVDNQRTLNLRIADFINIFQTRTHQDIVASTLPHTKLSNPVHLLDIDFSSPDLPDQVLRNETEDGISATVITKAVANGHITAILYWFRLHFHHADRTVDTSDPEGHWNQAAILLPHALPVEADEQFQLMASCRKSVVDIAVIKTK